MAKRSAWMTGLLDMENEFRSDGGFEDVNPSSIIPILMSHGESAFKDINKGMEDFCENRRFRLCLL